MEVGQCLIGRGERVLVREADLRHDVPVPARPPGQHERAAGRDHVQALLGIEHVGETEQVVLVGPAAVVEDQQPFGVARGGALLEGQGAHARATPMCSGLPSIVTGSTALVAVVGRPTARASRAAT